LIVRAAKYNRAFKRRQPSPPRDFFAAEQNPFSESHPERPCPDASWYIRCASLVRPHSRGRDVDQGYMDRSARTQYAMSVGDGDFLRPGSSATDSTTDDDANEQNHRCERPTESVSRSVHGKEGIAHGEDFHAAARTFTFKCMSRSGKRRQARAASAHPAAGQPAAFKRRAYVYCGRMNQPSNSAVRRLLPGTYEAIIRLEAGMREPASPNGPLCQTTIFAPGEGY